MSFQLCATPVTLKSFYLVNVLNNVSQNGTLSSAINTLIKVVPPHIKDFLIFKLIIVYHKIIEISTKNVKFNHILQKITIFYDLLQYFPISAFVQWVVVKLQWLFVSRRKGDYKRIL